MCSAAGIGGGALIIPLLAFTESFSTFYSVPLSVTSIVGGCIVRFFIQIQQKHPEEKHRRLVNFHLVLLLLPSMLAGTVLGVLMNSVSPSWLVTIVILVVLVQASFETTKKGLQLRRAQTSASISVKRVRVGQSDDDDDELLISENVTWPQGPSINQIESLAQNERPSITKETDSNDEADVTLAHIIA